jgi:hypothetical protein
MDFRKPKTLLLLPLIGAITSILAIVLFAIISGTGAIGTWGVNKTVGWAWDFADTASLLSILSMLLFVIGYAILGIVGMKLNKIVSIIHLCLLFALPVIWIFEHINYKYVLTFSTAFGVILSLITNIVFAIIYKLGHKQKIS